MKQMHRLPNPNRANKAFASVMENRCIVCGKIIPEGRQVCPQCENGYPPQPDDEEQEED